MGSPTSAADQAGKLRALAVSSANASLRFRMSRLSRKRAFRRGGLHLVGVFPPGRDSATIVQKAERGGQTPHPGPQVRDRLAFSAFDPVGRPAGPRAADYVNGGNREMGSNRARNGREARLIFSRLSAFQYSLNWFEFPHVAERVAPASVLGVARQTSERRLRIP